MALATQSRWAVSGLVVLGLWLCYPAFADAVKGKTLVVSRTFNGYQRTALPDGSLAPITYTLGNLGLVEDKPVANDSLNTVGFVEVAKILQRALASQGYIGSVDPQKTEELILVCYGNTRDLANKPTGYELIRKRNTRILGFEKELSTADTLSFTNNAAEFYREFYADRYFVVLKSFDFRIAREEKRLKLLWESRFSLQRQGEDFATELPRMASLASLTFGRETKGIFDPDRAEGRVEFGDLEVVEAQE